MPGARGKENPLRGPSKKAFMPRGSVKLATSASTPILPRGRSEQVEQGKVPQPIRGSSKVQKAGVVLSSKKEVDDKGQAKSGGAATTTTTTTTTTASSKKEVDEKGNARVVTVSTTTISTADPPEEPMKTIVLQPGNIGMELTEDLVVLGVTKGGSADKAGVQVGMGLLMVGKTKVADGKKVEAFFNKTNNKSIRCVFRPLKVEEVEKVEVPVVEEPIVIVEEPSSGNVTLHYNMYDESFAMEKGVLSPAVIDEEYCLSDVMPGCKIKLSNFKTDTRGTTLKHPKLLFADKSQFGNPYVMQDENENFIGLKEGREYWVYVIEDPVQEEKDRAEMAKVIKKLKEEAGEGREDENNEWGNMCREFGMSESCSCLEGAPCTTELVCKDWHRRFQIAKDNGWKGHV